MICSLPSVHRCHTRRVPFWQTLFLAGALRQARISVSFPFRQQTVTASLVDRPIERPSSQRSSSPWLQKEGLRVKQRYFMKPLYTCRRGLPISAAYSKVKKKLS